MKKRKQRAKQKDPLMARVKVLNFSPPPATEFIMQELRGTKPGSPQYWNKQKQAIIELIAGGVPIDPYTLRNIVDCLRVWLFPRPARDKRLDRQGTAAVLEAGKQFLIANGIRPGEAEDAIAEYYKMTTTAMRQRIKRARRELKGGTRT
jgi:hypothetical protein